MADRVPRLLQLEGATHEVLLLGLAKDMAELQASTTGGMRGVVRGVSSQANRRGGLGGAGLRVLALGRRQSPWKS